MNIIIAIISALAGGYLGYLLGFWLASRRAVTEIDRARGERLPIVTFGRNIIIPIKSAEGDYLSMEVIK